jgi:protein TonB
LEDESKSHPLDDSADPRRRRHVASFAASLAAHAIVVAMIVYFASPMARGHNEWVLAYLVEGAEGASGLRGGASAAAPGAAAIRAPSTAPASAHSAPPSTAARQPRRRPVAAAVASVTRPRAPAADAAPLRGAGAPSLAAVSGNGGSGSGAGAGTGAGTATTGDAAAGGDPDSLAHADYASNPPPTYPALARRREQQGTVTVRVLVGADGSVERAELAESSGFDALDDAALQTVRSRWRFVPARHDGVAVESWVLVPIRFALVEANAAR